MIECEPRMSSAIVLDLVGCSEWLEHKWKPLICANCKRPKNEHHFLNSGTEKGSVKEGQSSRSFKLSPTELKEIQDSFNEIDWDKDGGISREEFENYLERWMLSPKPEDIDFIFSTLASTSATDLSQNSITFGEFRLKWAFWKDQLQKLQKQKPSNPWIFPLQIREAIQREYEFGDLIAEGGFGSVIKATSLRTGKDVAIKVLPRVKFFDDDMFLALKKEICILGKVDHPNVCKLFEVFEGAENFYLVMELIEGKELFEYVKNRGHFSEPDAKKILTQVLYAVDYLHSVGVIHQDIKPENILLIGDKKDSMIVKIIDFGFATKLLPGQSCVNELALGTPEYIAPELCVKGQLYNYSIDMWAVGVITYLMLSGLLPFSSDDDEVLQKTICAVDYDFNDPIWNIISDSAKNFISKLLTADYQARMTARQALEHPWLKVDH